MARKIQVELIGDASQLDKVFGKAGRSASGFESSLNKASIGAAAALGALGLGAKAAFGEFTDAEKIGAQTAAALKSTGGAANVTQSHIEDLAGSLLNLSGVDDEAIQSGENLLLTFTKVQNKAGEGNDVFDQATRTMLDMSVALGTSTTDAALQLGKALNDPVRGVTALRRVGVSFTQAQQDQIKAMVAAGDTMGAQKLILGELTTEFGGSAKAAGDTFAGQIDKAKQQALNFSAELVSGAIPALTGLAGGLASATQFMSEHKELTKVLIGVVAGLSAAILATRAALGVYNAAQGLALIFTNETTAALIAQRAVLALSVVGALIAVGAALVVAYNKSETFRNVVQGAFNAVKTAAQAVADFVTQKIPAGFQAAVDWVRAHWPVIATIIAGPFAPLVALATDAFGIRSALTGAFKSMLGAARSFGDAIADAIRVPINAVISGWNAIGLPGFDINLPGPIPDIHFPGVSLPDIPHLDIGGAILSDGIAMVHKGEHVIPAGARGGTMFAPVFNLPNYLGTKADLIETLGPEMVRYARRNGIALGATA